MVCLNMSKIDDCSWKSLVHPSYWDSVTSHDCEEDGCTVYISTKEGAFIKFHKGVIEKSCRTCYCCVESIEQFFTYHPYKRYFLLREPETLVIISEEFNVHQVHTGVGKYEIGDFTGEGRPQIQLRPLDDAVEPFLLDLSSLQQDTNSVVTNQSKGFLSGRLQLKLKETKNVLAKFIEEVEHKRRLRVETLHRLAMNCPPEPSPPPAGLQLYFGDDHGENNHHCGDDPYPLQVLHFWQVIICGEWILGLALRNSSDRVIYNLKVFLDESSKQRAYYRVRRLNCANMDEVLARLELKTPQVPSSSAATFHEEGLDQELPPSRGCILSVVLPFPEFVLSSRKCISGRLSYSLGFLDELGDAFSQKLPSFEVTARSVLDDSLLLQSVHKTFLHAVSVISVSEKITLTVTKGISPSRTVEDFLTVGIGFSRMLSGDNVFLHSGQGSAVLEGSLIQVVHIADMCKMHLYARSIEILRLLIYSILESCPGSWTISCSLDAKPADVVSHSSCMTLGDCSEALSKEIHCIIYNLSRWKKDEFLHTLSTDAKSYIEFRREVITLQRKTDAIFSSLDLDGSKSGHVVYH